MIHCNQYDGVIRLMMLQIESAVNRKQQLQNQAERMQNPTNFCLPLARYRVNLIFHEREIFFGRCLEIQSINQGKIHTCDQFFPVHVQFEISRSKIRPQSISENFFHSNYLTHKAFQIVQFILEMLYLSNAIFI